MEKVSFHTDIYMGEKALNRLLEIRNKSIFLVTDPFIKQSGLLELIENKLSTGENTYCVFSEIIPNPPMETIAEGLNQIKICQPEIILVIGGGSAIDTAKAIKLLAGKILQLTEIPLIAIPTTSGTGSEVTSFAVITDSEKQLKYPLVDSAMLPDEAIIDPELVLTVPPVITADTGMDVLTHAIESYVSLDSNVITDSFCEKAVKIVFQFLEKAYRNGSNLEAREKMHIASCIAGIAFNQTNLGLNHGIAHVCGAKFNIPHGRINSILLPAVIEFNAGLQGFENKVYSKAAYKYSELARMIGLPASNPRVGVRSLINAIIKLQKQLNMPMNLRTCKVEKQDFEKQRNEVAQAALLDGCTKANPRAATVDDIEQILNNVY